MKTNTIVRVPLGAIGEDPRNFFETEGGEEIERKNAELMDSIRADGLIHPVTIRPNPDYNGGYVPGWLFRARQCQRRALCPRVGNGGRVRHLRGRFR